MRLPLSTSKPSRESGFGTRGCRTQGPENRLREIPMFAGCTRAELHQIDRLLCETSVPAGRVIVHEGQPADQFVVIQDGQAFVSRGGVALAAVERGARFGGAELMAGATNRVTVTAVTPMRVRAGTFRELRSLLDAMPHLEIVSPPADLFPLCGPPQTAQPPVDSRNSISVADEVEEFLRDGHEPDRQLAAVMFTDIVGSTTRLTEVGDVAWCSLLDAHDKIVEREIVRHGGTIVRFIGDGVLARFECARSAVRCALALRDALGELGIETRAGLHVGDVEVRGGDITGITVHVASRICDVAPSGSVLASDTLVELVAGSSLTFEDAGTYSLKGVNGEWNLRSAAG